MPVWLSFRKFYMLCSSNAILFTLHTCYVSEVCWVHCTFVIWVRFAESGFQRAMSCWRWRDQEGGKEDITQLIRAALSLPPPWQSQMSANLSVIAVLMSDGFIMRAEGGAEISHWSAVIIQIWLPAEPHHPHPRRVPVRFRQVRHNCHLINNIKCCKPGDTAMWAGGPL